ncbi:hypothetical protein [Parafilimonas sp.]|uniref:hypothetical protein n=1 Tax=Parafilimonas sp. TaxID=1969739 RepID=UPI0039E3A7CF
MIIFYILQWTELWATLIPVIVWIIKKPRSYYIKPVKVYLALILCLYIASYAVYFKIIDNNHYYYSLIAVCRLSCFAWFFSRLKLFPNKRVIPVVYSAALILIIFNFIFLEDFLTAFSSNTFSLEALILLVFCIRYFLKKLKADEVSKRADASSFIITGLAVYEAVCFPLFLFYNTLIHSNSTYAAYAWNIVQNINYLIFCLFIAKAFYESSKHSSN